MPHQCGHNNREEHVDRTAEQETEQASSVLEENIMTEPRGTSHHHKLQDTTH
jgi:hypothetical protein